jgi:hypothetical protein
MYLWFFHILAKKKKTCKIKVSLKKIFINQFQIYLLFTFIILKKFKFYTQLSINPMKTSIKNSIYFLVFL